MSRTSGLPVIGALLAGGQSRRFGSPKALAQLDGVRLIDRARQALEAAGLRPLLVERDGGTLGRSLGMEFVADAVPARGPLSGLVAALRVAHRKGLSGVVAVGVDQPFLPPELLRYVAERGLAGAQAVAAEGVGSLEPLGAFYSAATLPVAESLLAGGPDASLRALLEALPTSRIPMAELGRFGDAHHMFLNVNTQADLQRAARTLGDAVVIPADAREPESPAADLPPVYCVIGWKNSGKTSFLIELVSELSRRGYNVMTAKHGHGFQVDTPGTDSWRHRAEGGAARIALVGPDQGAVFGAWGDQGEPDLATVVRRFLADADVVIAEGFKSSPFPKIEVLRDPQTTPPLASPARGLPGRFLAVVSDVQPNVGAVATLPRQGAATRVADMIEEEIRPGS